MIDASLNPWRPISSVLVGVAALVATVVTLALFKSGIWRICFWCDLTTAELSSLSVIASCAVATGVGWACTAIVRRRTPVGFWESIDWRPTWRGILTGSAIGVFCCLLTMLISTRRNDLSLHVAVIDRPLLLVVLSVVLLEPLTEEIYFRGILFCGLKSKLNPYLSAGIVTAIFAFLHPQHRGIVLPIALTLGVFRIVGRSTSSCFALHLAYNLSMLLWGFR
ncbi:CAAX amino terminal protease family [Terriglobus roseus DSM 18391]|uniref:CAAX amino terminal protease family n=2 Tax=Terriglobus roseus TaxID=392734 RepID=I3ZLA4_TERRK|nr:CAAX amino terminal protease family [Terriglobus roseus DSM 18391]